MIIWSREQKSRIATQIALQVRTELQFMHELWLSHEPDVWIDQASTAASEATYASLGWYDPPWWKRLMWWNRPKKCVSIPCPPLKYVNLKVEKP